MGKIFKSSERFSAKQRSAPFLFQATNSSYLILIPIPYTAYCMESGGGGMKKNWINVFLKGTESEVKRKEPCQRFEVGSSSLFPPP